MTSVENEAAGEGGSSTALRAGVVRASLVALWVCAVAALVLMVVEIAHQGHWTWHIATVIGELVALPGLAGLDVLAADTGSASWLSRSGPYLPLLFLAGEGLPRPGVSMADWVPMQAVLLVIIAGAYVPTRALVLGRMAGAAQPSGDVESAGPQ
jgi:hypothetical protein